MSLVENIVRTYAILNGYPDPKPNLQLAEKAVIVVKEPTFQEKVTEQLWQTAEKVHDVVVSVVDNPLTKKLVKGVVNKIIDSAELGAMEKAAHILSDTVLPGDVAAVKIAFTLITGLSALAKQ